MSVDAILKEIGALSPEEQAELRARLQDLPMATRDAEMSPELAALLDERNATADANPDAGYTLEEVTAHVKRKK